jgi:hypothetical protein
MRALIPLRSAYFNRHSSFYTCLFALALSSGACEEAGDLDDTGSPSLGVDASQGTPPMMGMNPALGTTGDAGSTTLPVGNPVDVRDSGSSAVIDAGKVPAPAEAGALGEAGTSADAAIGAEGGTQSAIKPLCLKKPSQVVALGDSYVGAPVMLIPKVEALAVMGGALMSGQHYRDYGAPGTTLGSPEVPGSIPPQWDAAKRADMDIKTVIMDGGGNDIIASIESIFNGCLDPGSTKIMACTSIIQGAMNMVRKMAMDMKAAGVQDVIYFLYPHVPIGGDEILDYSVDEARKMTSEISTDSFRVHLVDTRATFMGHPEYFDIDPVHANDTGAQEIAKLVWQTMKTKCIAQPASSGCCQP